MLPPRGTTANGMILSPGFFILCHETWQDSDFFPSSIFQRMENRLDKVFC